MKKLVVLTLFLPMVSVFSGESNIASGEIAYADSLLEAYYSNANSDFNDFYGGTLADFPKRISPDVVLGNNGSFLSLPTGSFVIIGFTDNTIIDAPGQKDLFIKETGGSGEQAEIYVSSDNKDFVFLGIATDNGTSSFDLESIGFTDPVTAVKIIGIDNKGSSPGFDLVSVKALAGAVGQRPPSWV